jgi:hypothetical protein
LATAPAILNTKIIAQQAENSQVFAHNQEQLVKEEKRITLMNFLLKISLKAEIL